MDCDDDKVTVQSSNCRRRRIISNEEDEVVEEIDVYLNKNLSSSLHVLQYPLRPTDSKRSKFTTVDAKFKPVQQKLQLKCHLDTTSKNYDKGRGEQIAVNCSPSKSVETPIFSKVMDYQLFLNNNVGAFHTGCYAVGYYKNGCLHLNPVKDIFQMKPNFFYLDAADEKSRQSVAANVSLEGGESSQDETEAEPSAPQAIRQKFDVDESEAAQKRRLASYSYLQKIQDEERWMNLRFKDVNDSQSASLRESLKSDILSDSSEDYPKFINDSAALMRLFVPKAEEDSVSTPQLPSNVISLTQLRSLPVADQVQALMTNVKVIRFPQLLSLLPPHVDEQVVLKSLQHCSLLVQGCWVVKSDILYPRHAISPRTGVGGDVLCKARDYALYKFTQSPVIGRKDITFAVKIPAEDLQEILNQMARFKCLRGWQFMYPTDTDFIQNHADIVSRQNTMWDAKCQALVHQLNLRQRRVSDRQQQQQPGRTRHRTNSRSINDVHVMSGEEEDAASCRQRRQSSATNKPPTATTAKFTQLTNGVTTTPMSPPSGAAVAAASSTSAESVQTSLASQQSPINSAALRLEFRKFLYEKLSTRPVLTLADIKRQLLLKLAESPPGHILSKGISDQLVEQSASELGAVKIYNNKMTEPVFAYSGAGSWPDVRRVLIKLLEQKTRIQFKAFKQACTESLTELPNDVELKKILSEYCTQKSAFHTLIGT